MAGIGFQLNQFFSEANSFSRVKGAIYAIVLSSGPWLISILNIAIISSVVRNFLAHEELLIFKSIISYTYAISLLCFGFIEFPLTRYLADRIYKDDYSTFKRGYFLMSSLSIVVAFVIGLIIYSIDSFSTSIMYAGCLFLASTIVTWISMIFLSAARNFLSIVIGFFSSAIVGTTLAILLGKKFGLEGVLWGHTFGQITLALILGSILQVDFKGKENSPIELFDYFKKHKYLIFVGSFYYLGIWSDKLLFWYTDQGTQVKGIFYTNNYYDTAMFLAYLTIVPALAIFLIRVETVFYTYYKYYYESIEKKKTLSFLEKGSDMITIKLRDSFVGLLKVQIIVSFLSWYFMPNILEYFKMSPLIASPLQYGIIGALFQVVFFIMNILLLYFQDVRSVIRNYLVFFITNLVFSYITTHLSYRYHGLGYCLSSFATLLISYYSLSSRLENLNFFTFMSQPVIIKNESIIK